jgi:hypothetical protein
MPELTPAGRLKLLGQLSELIPAAIKELLEKKHLYQSVTLDPRGLLDHIGNLAKEIKIIENIGWVIPDEDHPSATTSGAVVAVQDAQFAVWLKAPDVKLFCEKCERVEAFNSVATHILVSSVGDNFLAVQGSVGANSLAVQVFAFSFLCQSCKSVPEVFLVRRTGLKLTLCGRAPIEHVEVPSFIPKQIQSFFRGGILAFQSGQILAGNFMLRTVIEQWARIATHLESADQADRILDSYMDSLPNDFKDRFPSMRELYDVLSADIHGAVGSSELFERAQKEIVQHFDARRLYKLPKQPR